MGAQSSTDVVLEGWFRAAADGEVDYICELLDCAVDIDVKDSRGITALMLAAANGRHASVRLLSEHGAHLDALDSRGWTAATHAAFKGEVRSLQLLAERGADLDAQDFLGTTAAMRAAIGGHAPCLRVLAEHGANLLAQDNLGMSAATHAQRKGHNQCLSLLGRAEQSLPSRRRSRKSPGRPKGQPERPGGFQSQTSDVMGSHLGRQTPCRIDSRRRCEPLEVAARCETYQSENSQGSELLVSDWRLSVTAPAVSG
mmetsp:Transcript_31504/g.83440  ORF Transcript_31504/g.83440 Transcript_31504/m.83440 type:complete len:256 (-) Transcript_31504:100-867(-)